MSRHKQANESLASIVVLNCSLFWTKQEFPFFLLPVRRFGMVPPVLGRSPKSDVSLEASVLHKTQISRVGLQPLPQPLPCYLTQFTCHNSKVYNRFVFRALKFLFLHLLREPLRGGRKFLGHPESRFSYERRDITHTAHVSRHKVSIDKSPSDTLRRSLPFWVVRSSREMSLSCPQLSLSLTGSSFL